MLQREECFLSWKLKTESLIEKLQSVCFVSNT